MRILFIGKFNKMWDEEHIARSFETLGHIVGKEPEMAKASTILSDIDSFKPDLVLFTKFQSQHADMIIKECKKRGIKTACWIFDLYWGYSREYALRTSPCFKADYVFTTDGGHDEHWKSIGINHVCIKQGIYSPECVLLTAEKKHDVIFVGSHNLLNSRSSLMDRLNMEFKLKWFGKENTDEVRGMNLNRLYAESKIVIGDSVYSPHYWSNRVVETLGRGGFLIHHDVVGIKEAYPHLVTYKYGDYEDLRDKIKYYLEHDEEREEIIRKNHEWVMNNCLCEHRCKELLSHV